VQCLEWRITIHALQRLDVAPLIVLRQLDDELMRVKRRSICGMVARTRSSTVTTLSPERQKMGHYSVPPFAGLILAIRRA
jgi:hypothetical protein